MVQEVISKPQHFMRPEQRHSIMDRLKKPIAALALAAEMVIPTTGLYVGADQLTAEAVYHHQGHAEIDFLAPDESQGKTPEAAKDDMVLVIPGLGVESGEGIASTLSPALSQLGKVAYLKFDYEGVSFVNIENKIAEFQQRHPEIKNLHLYCHSMGGAVAMNMLPFLTSHFKLKTMIFDSSPYDIGTVKKDKRAAEVLSHSPYPPGFISAGIGNTINEVLLHRNNELSLPGQVKNAWRVAASGVSSWVWGDQMGILGYTNPAEFARYIPRDLAAYYIEPRKTDTDDTVEVIPAALDYTTLFASRGVALQVLDFDKDGHANPTQRPDIYVPSLKYVFDPPKPSGARIAY
jgi:pimeloyl-ACP methyl ester carboxylesterase